MAKALQKIGLNIYIQGRIIYLWKIIYTNLFMTLIKKCTVNNFSAAHLPAFGNYSADIMLEIFFIKNAALII